MAESIALCQEMEDLLAAATPEERQWLDEEFAVDPVYKQALLGKLVTAETIGLISSKIEQERSSSSTQPNVHELLQDLEGESEAIAARSELQKQDIESIHSFVEGYNQQLPTGVVTKKQQGGLSRYLNGSYKERWQTSELAEDPMRLRNILDSLLSKEGVSTAAKTAVQEYIADKVCEYVKSTTATVDVDVLSRRIEASLLPGQPAKILQKSLLSPYFKQVEGNVYADDVIKNYEKFVCAIVRLVDKPEIARNAVLIADFETELLPEDSLYKFKATTVPAIRIDKPELFGRMMAALRTVSSLSAEVDGIAEINHRVPNRIGAYARAAMVAVGQGLTIKSASKIFKSGFNRSIAIEQSIALNVLGDEEYQKRLDVLSELLEICRDPEKTMNAIFGTVSFDDNDEYNYTSMMLYVGDQLKDKYPGMESYIEAIINTDYQSTKDLAEIVGDTTPKFSKVLRDTANGQAIFEVWRQKVKELSLFAGVDLDELNPDELVNIVDNKSKILTHILDDGYSLDVFVNPDDQLSEEEWQEILVTYAKRIEAAKQQVSQMAGITRRAVSFSDPDSRLILTVRPESEADRKAYHPLDAVLGDADIEEADDIPENWQDHNLAIIEACRLAVLMERRRFLNERGIGMLMEDENEKLDIIVNKHPRNPQYFICTVKREAEGRIHSAKVLMNPELRFEMGDKKVRSEIALSEVNAIAAEMLAYFMCEEAVETEEGTLSDERNPLIARIAHLRLLPEGQKFSFEAWTRCLQAEGLDLEVLSELQQQKHETERKSTYVSAVERDDVDLGPIRVYVNATETVAA